MYSRTRLVLKANCAVTGHPMDRASAFRSIAQVGSLTGVAHDDQGVDSTVVADDVEELRHVGFRLLVLTGELRGREFEVMQDSVRLGKSRQCNIVLSDESVSRVHSEIRREGGAYRVTDLRSTNGTLIGRARLSDA
jgi:hypothetical protein